MNGVKNKGTQVGFTIAELILAFGLLSIGILALGALSLSALKAGQKSTNVFDASQVAVKQLATRAEIAASDPDFWDTDHTVTPYAEGTQMVGKTEYQFRVYASTLMNAETGDTLGAGVPDNRVKKMDIVIEWYAESGSSGYGKKSLRQTCLVNESL